jgi:hypothetical protein
MVSAVKIPSSVNGYKAGDLVLLMHDGATDSSPRAICRVGLAGFFVRGSCMLRCWHDEGVTWRKFFEREKSNT